MIYKNKYTSKTEPLKALNVLMENISFNLDNLAADDIFNVNDFPLKKCSLCRLFPACSVGYPAYCNMLTKRLHGLTAQSVSNTLK